MEVHLKIIGFLLMALAMVHIIFPRYFNWKQELAPLSLMNRQLMYVHTFFVALVVLLIGVFCVVATHDIVCTRLGHQVSFGLFIFWATRLVFQFWVYSSRLWRGKVFETSMHIVFSFLWSYFSAVFFLIYWMERYA